MVRVGGDSSRKGARHFRYDDIPTDTFTPRTYQVELLESALQGNTIACLGSESSKVFLGLMVIQEKSHQIRTPLEEGGKRSVFLTNSEEDVETVWSTLFHHTFLTIGRAPPEALDQWSAEQWMSTFSSNNVLALSAPVFLGCLDKGYLPLTAVNLLVMNDCHKAVGDHAYVSVMSHVTKCGDGAPHLLCLTAAILGSECTDPQELASRIESLESTFHSKAETSMLVISERFGCRPKESIIECEIDGDVTGMGDQLATILYTAWYFLEDSQVKLDDQASKTDPLHVPKFAISECINILQTLGSWCAASIAENLISQLEKVVKHESNQMLKLFIRYTITQLRLVVRTFEVGFTPDYAIEELLKYTTSKVRELVSIFRKYKPEMDFMIITREGDEGDAISDLSDDEGNDDDSLDLSGSDGEDEKDKSSKHIHIAVKRVEKDESDSPFEDERKLSGLVFVDNRYVAFALNKMIEEVCSWDENLCFVKSSHITGQGIHRSDGRKDLSNASRKQEEILRRFRMQERNLLISTSVLEEGVDIPKCNLVVRFDPPKDYKSYTLSKGRARARDAEYVILVEEELMEDFSDEIHVFKGIEQVLIGAGRGRRDLEDAQEVQQLSQPEYTPLPTFCPLNQPGAASVSMKNSIALVNRYCAKLPSDAFTHLTPQCRVCQSPADPAQYVAYLRLPVNSPIKEELKGPAMPSRQLAKMAVALQMCELLFKAGELDCHLQPVGKEMFVCEEEEEWEDEEDEGGSQARPGTTKRKQYYIKKPADAFVKSHPKPDKQCFLYHVTMTLTGPITEDQNTRGRKIYAPQESTQSFGVLLSSEIPNVPSFPVYTRSGEVTTSLELLSEVCYTDKELEKLVDFHHFVFSSVLHLEKDPMMFSPEAANIGFLIVPLNCSPDSGKLEIEWSFVEEVNQNTVVHRRNVFDGNRDVFEFVQQHFEDAVVMPSYRNIDQPQHFYVAEIRTDLSPLSPFPSPELYKTFAAYYTTKYGLTLTNTDQPLLDVDHTSARLNLLTPRYMNQKGRALPTSSLETKRARRENLQQKQILVPELCDIHVFSASLWRKAVCLPAIMYRMNYLLLAEELRKLIAAETGIGKVSLTEGFRFPRLDFGFETNPEKLQIVGQKAAESDRLTEDSEKGSDASKRREESCTSRKESVIHDSSPDEDKTDTGASSDSDSGVVLSESDTGCASQPRGTAPHSLQPEKRLLTAIDTVDSQGSNPPAKQKDNVLEHVGRDTAGKTTSTLENLLPESATGKNLSSGIKEHNAKSCDISDPFYTPTTSRPSSPGGSDSSESVYEDAEDSPETTTVKSSKKDADYDTDALCQTHKLSPQNHLSSSSSQSVTSSTSSLPSKSEILLPSSAVPSRSSTILTSSSSKSSSVCPPVSDAPVISTSSDDISTSSSTHSPVLAETKEETVSESKMNLPQSLHDVADTTLCPQSQKVPDRQTSPYLSNNHRSNTECHISASALKHGEESSPCIRSTKPDLNKQGHISQKSQPTENQPDSLQSHPLTEQNLPNLNHKEPTVCGEHIKTRASQNNKDHQESEFDEFLDVTGSNHREKSEKSHTVTFPVDPEISHFTKPSDEVKLSFESLNNVRNGLDANWARPSMAAASAKEWAPDEDLTTFEVDSNLSDMTGENKEDGFSENPQPESKLEDLTTIEVNSNLSSLDNLPDENNTDAFSKNPQPESKLHPELSPNKSKSAEVKCDVSDQSDRKASSTVSLKESEEKNGALLTTENKQSPSHCHVNNVNIVSDLAQKDNAVLPSGADVDPVETVKSLNHSPSTEAEDKTAENDKKSAAETEALGWGTEEEALDPSEWMNPLLNSTPPDSLKTQNQTQSVPKQDPHDSSTASSSLSCTEPSTENGPVCVKNDVNETKSNCSETNAVSSAEVFSRKDSVSGSKEMCTGAHNQAKNKNQTFEDTPKLAKEKESDSPILNQTENSVSNLNQETTVTKNKPPKTLNHTTTTTTTVNPDQFDIGTWNTGKKQNKDVKDGTQKDAETVESRPLMISLDHDTDLETFMGPSPCLLLQALTMSNANDFFSLERLETIGDSFLKYAITVYLYCCYPGTHEGKLSYLRSKQVSNYNLYRLGRRKGLAERMVSTKFEPYENWLPPGYIISEDRRRGPVPKVVIATCNPKLSAAAPVNFLIEEELSESEEDQKKETDAFHAMVEEMDRQQAVDQQIDISSSHKHAMVPYCLQLHHGIPDKSVADCVEALIGCYLTTCGKQAALTFMSWVGLKVLPRKRVVKHRKGEEVKVTEFQELQCPPSPLLRSVPEAEDLLNQLLEGFSEFEVRIDYKFRDRSYLLQAFTHASYHYNYITDCYQRLEFLGDAILDYVITRHLYEDSQRYSPGILTDLRSALVNNNIFAALAVKWDFHKFFKAISPSLFIVIDKFVVRQKEREDQIDEIEEVKKPKEKSLAVPEEEEEDDTEDGDPATAAAAAVTEGPVGEIDERNEEVELEIPKSLGDIFESVAGAIYLDSGMSLDTVWRVYYRMMKPHIDKYLKDIPKSPVRELLEMEPETAKFEKPERTLDGKIRVMVNVVGKGVFYGVGRNYRIAKSAAAKKALRFIRNLQEGLG